MQESTLIWLHYINWKRTYNWENYTKLTSRTFLFEGSVFFYFLWLEVGIYKISERHHKRRREGTSEQRQTFNRCQCPDTLNAVNIKPRKCSFFGILHKTNKTKLSAFQLPLKQNKYTHIQAQFIAHEEIDKTHNWHWLLESGVPHHLSLLIFLKSHLPVLTVVVTVVNLILMSDNHLFLIYCITYHPVQICAHLPDLGHICWCHWKRA